MASNKFWLTDARILYMNNNYLNFLPSNEMSKNEILNALSRLFIYLIIIILIFGLNEEWLIIPIGGILMIVLHYYLSNTKTKQNKEPFKKSYHQKKRYDNIILDESLYSNDSFSQISSCSSSTSNDDSLISVDSLESKLFKSPSKLYEIDNKDRNLTNLKPKFNPKDQRRFAESLLPKSCPKENTINWRK